MSPYLEVPTRPLAVALPRMLEKIETELRNLHLSRRRPAFGHRYSGY